MKMDGSDGCTLWIYIILLNCVLKNGWGDKLYLCVFYHTKNKMGEKGQWNATKKKEQTNSVAIL